MINKINTYTVIVSLIFIGLYYCTNTIANNCWKECRQQQEITGYTCSSDLNCGTEYPTFDDVCCYNPTSGGQQNCTFDWLTQPIKKYENGLCKPLCCYTDGPKVCVAGSYIEDVGYGSAIDDTAWGTTCP